MYEAELVFTLMTQGLNHHYALLSSVGNIIYGDLAIKGVLGHVLLPSGRIEFMEPLSGHFDVDPLACCPPPTPPPHPRATHTHININSFTCRMCCHTGEEQGMIPGSY